MNLFVIAGHSIEAPGAKAWNGSYEHDYTQRAQKWLSYKHRVVQLDGSVMLDEDNLSLREVIEFINQNAKRGDYGIDIHFNNNNPAATGTEGFVSPKTTKVNKKIATEVIQNGSDIMGLPVRRYLSNRTYKYPSDINRTLGIIKYTKIPMFLYEVCFLTGRDMAKYLPVEKDVWRMVAEVYKKHIGTF